MKPVVTRFSPSNTGFLHIGGLRTALYNYIFAKKHNGKFLLRIEDSDIKRSVSGSTEYIKNALTWLGLNWDDEVLVQSERLDIYKEYALKLIANGNAYYAFDDKDELAALRGTDPQKPIAYGAYTRDRMKNSLTLSPEAVDELLANGTPYVIRFKVEKNREIVFNDAIRERVSFNTNNVDDKVLLKSDGFPTYFLANTIDDALCNVTHVIKGNEWLSSAPIIILLYEALGFPLPEFCHLPLVLDEDKKKISKRNHKKYSYPIFPLTGSYVDDKGADFSVIGLKEAGYLPEAVINAMALVGWTPKGTNDVLSMDEIIAEFDLNNLHKSDAIFGAGKLKFLNKEYLKKKEFDYLISFIDKGNIYVYDDARLKEIVAISLERSNFNYELNDAVRYFFEDVEYTNTKSKNVDEFNKFYYQFVSTSGKFGSKEVIEFDLKSACSWSGVEKGKILPGLRNALCGGASGADLITTMWILGEEVTYRRIVQYHTYLKIQNVTA